MAALPAPQAAGKPPLLRRALPQAAAAQRQSPRRAPTFRRGRLTSQTVAHPASAKFGVASPSLRILSPFRGRGQGEGASRPRSRCCSAKRPPPGGGRWRRRWRSRRRGPPRRRRTDRADRRRDRPDPPDRAAASPAGPRTAARPPACARAGAAAALPAARRPAGRPSRLRHQVTQLRAIEGRLWHQPHQPGEFVGQARNGSCGPTARAAPRRGRHPAGASGSAARRGGGSTPARRRPGRRGRRAVGKHAATGSKAGPEAGRSGAWRPRRSPPRPSTDPPAGRGRRPAAAAAAAVAAAARRPQPGAGRGTERR